MSKKLDIELYAGKTFSDLLKDIDKIAADKRKEINEITKNMGELITSINDAALLGPILAQFYAAGIKNDEALTRMAAVIQRIIASKSGKGEELTLSDAEREQLLKDMEMEKGRLEESAETSSLIDDLKKTGQK